MSVAKAIELVQGITLKLKPARQAAYGLESPVVRFVELKFRNGYKTPFIIGDDHVNFRGVYFVSDFA